MSASENPADVILSAETETRAEFSDLSERQALKLSSMTRYVSRAHFHTWEQLRRLPDFNTLKGVFTPLVCMEIEATDARVQPGETLHAHGQSYFGKVLDAQNGLRHIARDGRYEVCREDGEAVGGVRFVNVFTRYDDDPAKRKVLELPAELGVGTLPSRVTELPAIDNLVPRERRPDFSEEEANAWYYTQTDPNRHVNSLAYLHVAQDYAASRLHHAGRPMDRLWARCARVVFRKPCFRGEAYHRLGWQNEGDPPTIAVAIAKSADPSGHLPAAAVELTLALHEPR